eukprot:TRINITY_DN456_c0_g1_i4.p1 TRINITY_DN456_c0_g1~~TRINITY_DN456_c0_g1_i4.p1  ORF type:complete len:914 (-),score=271.70 TRINITY_DN456_c0_g1_i4:1560-3962(-)
MTSDQIDEAVSCGFPTEKAKLEIPRWLVKNGLSREQIKTTNSYVRVEYATVAQIESLFDVEMLYHQHKANGKTLLRARGILTMPNAIAEHVTFVSGLTELLTPVKNSVTHPADSHESPYAQALTGDGVASYLSATRKNPPLSPRLIRRLYNLRQNLTGGTASNNSFGIGAFTDYFYEDDLCYASDLFGRDPVDGIYVVPSVDYNGPLNGSDNFESSLDIQFATALAPNVKASFWNHGGDEWILTWAQQAVNEITGQNGPWVWSLSYGWPEVGHCVSGALPLDTALCFGIDYKQYVETTNNELMKLALMGVTVFVSSGDAGSPGFTIYCPVDPSKPSAFGGAGLKTACPSSTASDCKCGSFTLEYDKDGVNTPCFLPMALGGDIVNGQIGGLSTCTLLDFQSEDIVVGLFTVLNQWVSDINGTCTSSFDMDNLIFASLCTCDQLPSHTYAMVINQTSGETVNVTLSGYQYKTEYSTSMFFPDYPTASPYVVSVGATQIDPFDEAGACGQSPKEIFSSILSGAFISGGGGFSVVSAQPSWQSSAVSAYLKTGLAPPSDYFNSSNRAYPDISLNGHNYPVVVGGQVTGVDGTSASSPTLAAMFALMNEVLLSHGKKPLGLLTPLLYQMAVDEPTAFNKITPGTDSAGVVYGGDNTCTESYCCQYGYKTSSSGWDPVTGLGTPNMAVIENYIRKVNGLPSIAEEAAALNAPATNAPTQAVVTTNAPIATITPTATIAPTATAAPTAAAAASEAGATTKTVTTAGATVMVILAFFFGVVGTVIYFKTRKPKDTSDSKAILLAGQR